MASQHSHVLSSKSKKLGSPLFPIYCYHDEVAPLRTVKHGRPTQGKRFYDCSYTPEHSTCGFFKWVDDIRELQYQNVDKNSIIMELEDKIELLKEKVRKLKAKQEKLVDQVEEMGMATTETLFEMKENNTDKKLMLTLIFTLGIFHCSVVDEVQVVVLGCSTRLQC
ncbi:uncharacterized protein LOC110721183 [Chenopodium quinoa]|uniref:uncharacterized protein LOC110721183 n=1 Tax=Chenopodium quinoa TaxID=63459 RepID=UPI000B76BAFF|nr:uncharacterized protein LOC110721183 [Chenopodium quinoa]